MKNLGTQGYCTAHLAEIYRACIPGDVWLEFGGGIGLPDLLRPDCGSGYAELTCSCCGAGWLGAIFERCPWCVELLEKWPEWQADKLLAPPDVRPGERYFADRMRWWGDALSAAVEAGMVPRERALSAWRRAVDNVRAA